MSKEKGCKCCKQIWYVDMLDKKLKLCPNCYEYCKPLFDDLKIKDKQIAKLEAKLAEKDKEIEIVKHERNANGASYMSACKMLTKERQDKISFAVEQLNYLQDIIDDRVDEYLKSHDMDNYDCFVTHQGMYSCFEILVEEIDNQIKQLKEMK